MSETGNQKTMLLGVGCQKGGTTWLHDQLKDAPQVAPGFMKEYHIFDALDLETMRPYLEKTRKAMALAAKEDKPGQMRKRLPALRRMEFYADPESYFDYFHYQLLREPETRLAFDITPSYAGLSAERLAFIRDGFARRGVRVKAVFLMRDPVERAWSAVRMNYRRIAEQDPESARLKRPQDKVLRKSYDSPGFEFRNRYDLTMANLERVFPAEDIHYELYERLFTDEAVDRICAFLGLDRFDVDFGRRVNASPKTSEISPGTARLIANTYPQVYEAAEARLGAETIAALWPSRALLDQRPTGLRKVLKGGKKTRAAQKAQAGNSVE